MSGLKKLAVQGVFWTVLGFGSNNILRLIGNVLLAWFLPKEFLGLMVIVNIFLTGLQLFSDVGINLNIIQSKRGEEPAFYNTAWTMQILRGFLIFIFCLLLCYPFSLLYNNPQLAYLIPLMGITTIIGGFQSTALLTLERKLQLKKLTLLEICLQTITITVMVLLAWRTRSIEALVIGTIVSVSLRLCASHLIIPKYRNKLCWDQSAVKDIFSIGRWVFLSTAITFLAEQSDRLLLAKLFDPGWLAVYNVALMFGDVPRQIGMALGARVILPVASQLAREESRPEMRRKLLKNRRLLTYALMTIIIFLAGFGDRLVDLLYSNKPPTDYTDAQWMLPIIALGIWPRILCSTIEPSLFAIAKLQYSTIANVTRFAVTSIGILIGFKFFGAVGAVIAVALNDLFYYTIVNYGLYKEGLSGIRQDITATGVMLLTLGVIIFIRLQLGLGLPIEALFR
jgi:O-antigen/teichoic acid export membrane protein